MDLSDRQRRLVFGALVVALGGLGVYLSLPGDDATGSPERRPTPAATAPAASPTPPPGIGSTVTPETFDIYRLLPFPQKDFATAADLAQRFTAAYGTYRFDEEPQAYVDRLGGMITPQLRAEIARGASAPGLLDERRQEQVVAEGTATLDRIRTIEDNSVIFLVTGQQRLTRSGEQSQERRQYAVTVARDGGSWRVYAFEPADAGQAGDTG